MDKIVGNMFGGWNYVHNLEKHYKGGIVVVWRPDYYSVRLVHELGQEITCEVECIPQKLF